MRLGDLDALKDKIPYLWSDPIDIGMLLDLIDNAPTVPNEYMRGYEAAEREYKRPQGEWLFDKENSFTIDMYRCSICGYFGHTHFKFCPNCGADMRGVE